MTSINATELTPRQVYQSLVDRLTGFRGRVRERLVFEGAARVITAAVLLALLTFVLDRLFRLSLTARVGMVVTATTALLIFAWRQIVAPLRLKLDPLTLAAALDRMVGHNGDLTANVGTILELPAMMARPGGESTVLLQKAAARCHAALSQVQFESRLNNTRRNLAAAVIGIAVLIPIAIASAAPGTTRLWAQRVLGGSNEPWPQKTYLQVDGVDEKNVIVVPRGEPFVLRVMAKPGSVVPETVTIKFREGDGDRIEANLTTFGPNDFRYDFASINAPVDAEIFGGDDAFGPLTLRPADRPKITDLKLITQHPTEKSPSSFNFNGSDSELSFLPRTAMQLQFTANTPIAAAKLKSSTTQPAASDLRQIDERHFSIAWTHAAGVQLQIELASRDAGLASVPSIVTIGLKTDQPPRVTLGYTGVKSRITTRARIPLTIDARDDYGVSGISLVTKTETADPSHRSELTPHLEEQPLFGPANPAVETEVHPKHVLELDVMKLPIGSLVTVSARASDACYIGPQTTKSREVTFRVVAPEELFREILLRQQAERAKFRKQSDEARAVRDQMNAVPSQDIAASLGRRHRVMQREITRISTVLAESLTEMKLNALGTDEAYEMMQSKVLSPLQQLNDELVNPQKDALDQLRFDDTTAVAAATERQDQLITRMGVILKQMSQWDSFVDVLNQLNEIIKLQSQAEQKTTELKKSETEGVFDK